MRDMHASDEHLLVARLESANVDELAEMLLRPSPSDEKALRMHLGSETYVRMHELALRAHAGLHGESDSAPRNVVVLPDFMGSELTVIDAQSNRKRIWLDSVQLVDGNFSRLRLGSGGLSEANERIVVRPTGIRKRVYGELLLTLHMAGFRVRAFWYDWRKDIGVSAAQLEAEIDNWFNSGEPVHLVAHGMGGLVARTYLSRYPRRFAEAKPHSRLVMLGTPNHGTCHAVQMLAGTSFELRALALLDDKHRIGDIASVTQTFVGLYQLLPHAQLDGPVAHHPNAHIEPHLLEVARALHDELAHVVDVNRMVHIVGYGHSTPTILHSTMATNGDITDSTFNGDGVVTLESARLSAADGRDVPMFYVNETHFDLPLSPRVLGMLPDLLQGSYDATLVTKPPVSVAMEQPRSASGTNSSPTESDDAKALATLRDAMQRIRALRGSINDQEENFVSSYEREIADALTHPPRTRAHESSTDSSTFGNFPPPEINIRVCLGTLSTFDGLDDGDLPIDAIAIGHYEGTVVGSTLGGFDLSISRELLRRLSSEAVPERVQEKDLLLTQFVQRGVIDGRLGKPFFVNDPRPSTADGRVIVVIGMGLPGRFGSAEAKILARELCWAVDRLGKRHVATTLIGAAHAQLSIPDVVAGWMRGIKNALTGSHRGILKQVTIVEWDPKRAVEIDAAIAFQAKQHEARKRILFHQRRLTSDEVSAYHEKSMKAAAQPLSEPNDAASPSQWPRAPTRVTVSLDGDTYSFGAIADNASIPERPIPIDRRLVEQANEELAAEANTTRQLELGQFLGKLLVPQDFAPELWKSKPLVLLLDESTARVHWEFMAAPDELGRGDDEFGNFGMFLGARGLTRQLRTAFAPMPEPSPPPQRILRVLVVADPAEDAPLYGAEEEGAAVADLFEKLNRKGGANRVEVVRMLGPRDATRTAVLRQLMLRTYDVLHFAGHCRFDEQNTNASGWVFSRGELLTARELRRLDRIPRFVFSNACQSGITPDRSEQRDPRIAPNFALSFFDRGVANFICTAWPVDDIAARTFALALYTELLGLGENGHPLTMHEAMIKARESIAVTRRGALTWGAYQHYGSPFSRFFDPDQILV